MKEKWCFGGYIFWSSYLLCHPFSIIIIAIVTKGADADGVHTRIHPSLPARGGGGLGVLMASRQARPRPPPALRDRSGRAANPRLRRPSHRPLILYWLSFLLLLSVMIKSKFQFYTLYRIWRISVIWAPLVAEWRTTEEQQNKARLRILFCPLIRTHHHDIHGRPNRLWTQILAML